MKKKVFRKLRQLANEVLGEKETNKMRHQVLRTTSGLAKCYPHTKNIATK